MSIKTKITVGVAFLFALLLMLGGVAIYSLHKLSEDARNIIADNYESLEYSRRIIQACDSVSIDSVRAMEGIAIGIAHQEENITEPGERELTIRLREILNELSVRGGEDSLLAAMRQTSLQVEAINLKAILRKNDRSESTSRKASLYLIIIGSLCCITAFIFIVNFPGYIANPVIRLTNGIKAIAGKNYEERLHFDRTDEFEELAEAFNQMAEKLDEYEHSHLARTIFEKKRIETIINKMSDPVIGLDESGRIIFANEKAIDLLGLDAAVIIGQYAPDVAVNNDLFRSLLRHDGADTLIKAVVDARENYFVKEQLEVSYRPTGEKGDVRIGMVLLLRNVTSYKELDLAKTNFIATISHELKTPIASTQMCIRLLRDSRVGALNPEQQNIVTTLSDEVSRLSRITNELLDLSQVETGNIKLDVQRVSVGDIIRTALDAVHFLAEQKRVRLMVDEHESMSVMGDREKSTWVLINFLTNAIRFSDEGEVIRVSASVQAGVVRLMVEDHGPGIEPQHLERLFEKFYQVPGRKSGTGLGLSIAKEFIEAENGRIGVNSTPGVGSTFFFELPQA